jgi:hypothetical protein
MTNWRQDSIHLLLGLTLALVFLGVVITIGGLLVLLLTVMAPSSLRQVIQSINRPMQIGLLVTALVEVIAWNVLPAIGFAPRRMAQRMAVGMGGVMLFMAMSLLFSL